MEDLFSSIIVAIIAIISIVIKAMGNKPKKSSPMPPFAPDIFVEEEQTPMHTQPKMAEESKHPDSLETIYDEILGNQSTHQRVETTTKQVTPKRQPAQVEAKPKRINATNRTFQRDNKIEAQVDTKAKKEPKKFNIREAVIYSEILTPKFKDEE